MHHETSRIFNLMRFRSGKIDSKQLRKSQN